VLLLKRRNEHFRFESSFHVLMFYNRGQIKVNRSQVRHMECRWTQISATWIALLENQTQPLVQSVFLDFAVEVNLPEANCYFILFLQ